MSVRVVRHPYRAVRYLHRRFHLVLGLCLSVLSMAGLAHAGEALTGYGQRYAEPRLATAWGSHGSGRGLPFGIAVDHLGQLYIADYDNHLVQVVRPDGTELRRIGRWGSGPGQFSSPRGLALDRGSNLYVTDGSARVQVFNPQGALLRSWGSAGSAPGQFNSVADIAIDRGDQVYVLEAGNARVQVFDTQGSFLRMWGTSGSGPGQFQRPTGIAIGPDGTVAVLDAELHVLQMFSAEGQLIRRWPVFGSDMNEYPVDLTIDRNGDVYVLDGQQSRVYVYDYAGIVLWTVGGYGRDEPGMLFFPRAIAVSADDRLYVADSYNRRIQILRLDGTLQQIIPTVVGGQLRMPRDVAIDSRNDVYVVDTDNDLIQVFDAQGVFQRMWGWGAASWAPGHVRRPQGLAIDRSDRIYVADGDNHRIQVFDTQGSFLRSWGSYGTGSGQLHTPMSVALGPNDEVYVAERGNHRIQVFDTRGRWLRSWGRYGTGPGQFNEPSSVRLNQHGEVYVVDTQNHRIQVFDSQGTLLWMWGTRGTEPGQLNLPVGLAIDGSDEVYVAEVQNRRIQIFSREGGFKAYFQRDPDDTVLLNQPQGVAISAEGTIFVADAMTDRMEAFTFIGAVPVAASNEYRVTERQGLTVAAPGVLVDDAIWPATDAIAVVSRAPSHGSLTLRPDGSFTYLPSPGFTGEDSFGYLVRAGTLESMSVTVKLIVEIINQPPIARISGGNTVAEGATLTLDAAGSSDPDDDNLTYSWDLNGDGSYETAVQTATFSAVGRDGPASQLIGLRVTDSAGLTATATTTVMITNAPPTTMPPQLDVTTPTEGATVRARAGFGDPSVADTPFSCTVDYGDGTGPQPGTVNTSTCFGPTHTYADGDSYVVTISVRDKDGASGVGSTSITVSNMPPVIGPISGPSDPVPVQTFVTVTAGLSDPGASDTHSAVWSWGDGSTSAGVVTAGQVAGSHQYTVPGVYTLRLTVTDDDGASAQMSSQSVVVYNSAGGEVSGTGTIASPVGAYLPDPSLAGLARFSVSSKYQAGATIPTGQTQFRIEAADQRFVSTSYQWLVVRDAWAQLKGLGTINGQGEYGFLLTLLDGDAAGGGGVDRLRMKIWDRASGVIVYDSQRGDPDDASVTTTLQRGSVLIRK